MGEGKEAAPTGWLEVPAWVSQEVIDAVKTLGPNYTPQDSDAWGSGISPRVLSMIKSLAQGERLGPTTVKALRHILGEVDDETFALLGGDMTLRWAFAPQEFDAYKMAVERIPDRTDDELDADPVVAQALKRLNAAVDDAFPSEGEEDST